MTRCFVPRCFDFNCLLHVNCSLKIVLSNLPFERLALSESSSAVTLLFHADWMRVEQIAWLLLLSSWNPGRGCWSLRKLHLAVSTWILNGSSIECHEKKHQPFSLSGVRFGSRAIQISVWKSAWRWSTAFINPGIYMLQWNACLCTLEEIKLNN